MVAVGSQFEKQDSAGSNTTKDFVLVAINNQVVELLAPARDLECGNAAIDFGADAVYVGAPRFGAREGAGNSLQDIARLTEHAHKYWAKVYVTVNTLLRDSELDEARQLICDLHSIGIDGLIVQDAGILEMDLPPIALIASTQMHNNTPQRVAFLEKVGFSRAILARELDIDQIKTIRQQTEIELECFIHGSLCVGYSGQCYLSYALGGRSGNRGQCAQPCRKSYSLYDADGRQLAGNSHLLSLKDLNLSEHIEELIEAGVSSFKIEGRLKDRAYVANIVAFYRAKLDELGVQRSSSGKSKIDFIPDPNKTFNRDYTTHFLHGVGDKVGRPQTPKMIGERIGTVRSAGRRFVRIEPEVEVHRGDGICFFDKNGEMRGSVINEVYEGMLAPDKPKGIEAGTILYRNRDHEFLTQIKKSQPQRLIDVRLSLSESADGLVLRAIDEDGCEAQFEAACEKTTAEKPDKAIENIRKQLMKTGGTQFDCSRVDVDLSEPLFVPISVLNALRRGALEELGRAREDRRPKLARKAHVDDFPYPAEKLTFEGNVLNKLAEDFYKRHGVKEIDPAAESGIDLIGTRVMTTRYCLRHQLDMCGDDAPLTLVDNEGHRLELRFDCKRCGMEVFRL